MEKRCWKEICDAHGRIVFGTSPERPHVDSYIVFRHLSETTSCRAPWMGSHNPRTSCVDRQTSSRALQHQPTQPLSLHPQNYTLSGLCVRITRQRPRCSAHVGGKMHRSRPPRSKFHPTRQQTPDPRLRMSTAGSWSRCIGIARAPCGP